MRFLAVVLSLVATGPLAAEPVYELTLDLSARGVDGRPLYVTDEQLRAKIPELRNLGERIETCMQSMTEPMFYNFTYAPTVTAPHQALTNSVGCEGNRRDTELRCRADISRSAVVFDADPSRYFALSSNTDRDSAIEVFRAFNEGRIVYSEETKPWIKGLKVREITQEGSTFVVGKADCGCNEKVAIERRSEGTVVSFVAIKKLEGMCI
jgi:hypothetical protein